MAVTSLRKSVAGDTTYMTFKTTHSDRGGSDDSGATVDANSGKSPMTRWLSFAFDYDDFVSHPLGVTGFVAACPIPRGTIILRALARVDTLFAGTHTDAITIGDSDDPNGWGDALNFQSTGLKQDPDSAYNWHLDGTGTYHADADTVYVLCVHTVAPTAGAAILLLEVISYHEALEAEF